MKNLCIIPARSGSKGVPGKNIKPLSGKPLLEYTIDAAVSSTLVDTVMLNTDCAHIAAVANGTSVQVPFLRPSHLAQDHTPTYQVVQHTIQYFDSIGVNYDNIILLQPTCPFREDNFVDQCIEHFIATGADSLVSVKKVPHEFNPHWVFEPNENGFIQIATGEQQIIPSRQLLPDAYFRDGSVYVFKSNNLRVSNNLYGQNIAMLESTSPWHVNIDTMNDWNKAEKIAAALHVAC